MCLPTSPRQNAGGHGKAGENVIAGLHHNRCSLIQGVVGYWLILYPMIQPFILSYNSRPRRRGAKRQARRNTAAAHESLILETAMLGSCAHNSLMT
eukprot:1138212-Pelagomonas_calceolata.AAC.2